MNCENLESNETKGVTLPEGVPPLISLYLYLAGSCNLACKHCWIVPEFDKNPTNNTILPFEYIQSVIDQAKPLGLQSVKLTGGEPLLHPRFKDIITLITEEDLFCPIETNGTLIDEDMACFLAAAGKKIFISISLDGGKAATHENLRGVKGSFKKSIDAIKYLVKNGLKPQIICTLHKDNKEELEEVIKMAEDLGCSSVKFNLVQEIGRGNNFKKEFGFTVEETLELYHYVENSIIPHSKLFICFDIPPAFFPIKRFLNTKIGRCQILNILGVLHTGHLSLCGIGTSVPELIFGHIEKEKLSEVWSKSPNLQNLREIVPDKLEGVCYDCIHKNFCLGTCIANNYVRTGRLDNSYSFCEEANELGLFPGARRKQVEESEV